jgi:transposase
VAAMYDELGIGELIDTLIPQDLDRRHVSIGQIVKAMTINGLGFTQGALYLSPHFFQNKPVERLIGEGVRAEHLNDTTIGRAMDTIFEQGTSEIFAQISMKTVRTLGLDCKIGHVDTTSFHTDGVYNSHDEEPEEGVIHITKGYSRDHRPDLNQIGLQMICEHQAGIPILMEPLSGNSVDKDSFHALIRDHIQQLNHDVGLEYLIADSALYTAKSLKEMGECLWVTRVPETINLAKEMIAAVAPDWKNLPKKQQVTSLSCQYAGIKQRWIITYSPEAKKRATKTINKQWLAKTTDSDKQFKKLCAKNFSCEEDARKALNNFKEKQSITEVVNDSIEKIARYKGRGRIAKDRQPDSYDYQLRGALLTLIEPRGKCLQRKSCYILATNQLDDSELPENKVISLYKSQQKVERGFRFLKDPMFMSSSFFLKSPKRIMVLTMIMTLSLLLYAALEYRIRQALKNSEETFPNQKRKGTNNPTVRWVFQYFIGIHILTINESQQAVLNINSYQAKLLHLLGKKYEKVYSEKV